MRFLKGALPHICIALNICLLVIVYLDRRNPMMGFLVGAPFFVVVVACVAASVTVAGLLYYDWRKPKKRRNKQQNTEKIQNNT